MWPRDRWEREEEAGEDDRHKRRPLADIMVKDGLGPEVDSNQCPVCRKSFKNSKGVLSHRSARNSSCKPGKNHLRFTEKTSGLADSDKENSSSSTGGILASFSAPHLVRNIPEESVILIDDFKQGS